MEVNPVIENNFSYHVPTEDQVWKYNKIRQAAKHFAYLIDRNCPSNREKSLAMTNLEQAIFWANASIAREIK